MRIDLNGPWQLYNPIVPPGFKVHGTITRCGGDTGALLQNEKTFVLVQANAGVLRSLPQHDIWIRLMKDRLNEMNQEDE